MRTLTTIPVHDLTVYANSLEVKASTAGLSSGERPDELAIVDDAGYSTVFVRDAAVTRVPADRAVYRPAPTLRPTRVFAGTILIVLDDTN